MTSRVFYKYSVKTEKPYTSSLNLKEVNQKYQPDKMENIWGKKEYVELSLPVTKDTVIYLSPDQKVNVMETLQLETERFCDVRINDYVLGLEIKDPNMTWITEAKSYDGLRSLDRYRDTQFKNVEERKLIQEVDAAFIGIDLDSEDLKYRVCLCDIECNCHYYNNDCKCEQQCQYKEEEMREAEEGCTYIGVIPSDRNLMKRIPVYKNEDGSQRRRYIDMVLNRSDSTVIGYYIHWPIRGAPLAQRKGDDDNMNYMLVKPGAAAFLGYEGTGIVVLYQRR